MTRKDYELIAAAIRRVGTQPEHYESADYLICELIDAFKADNPRFDMARFLKACGR